LLKNHAPDECRPLNQQVPLAECIFEPEVVQAAFTATQTRIRPKELADALIIGILVFDLHSVTDKIDANR
jgi:hypothetical protein